MIARAIMAAIAMAAYRIFLFWVGMAPVLRLIPNRPKKYTLPISRESMRLFVAAGLIGEGSAFRRVFDSLQGLFYLRPVGFIWVIAECP